MAKFLLYCILLAAQLLAYPAAQAADDDPTFEHLGHALRGLQQEAVYLERDLILLEEQLLHPPAGRATLYVTVDPDLPLTLQSVQFRIDDDAPRSHGYDDSERQALRKGGAQRLQRINLPPGRHRLRIIVKGHLAEAPFQSEASAPFTTGDAPVALRLQIGRDENGTAPLLTLGKWR
ncbi:MAG: hypothetical protein ACE5ET_05760 [Gammaproteobacteria bacterium]